MTLEQYWAILIKHWKLVVICFLFVGVGTFIGSRLMQPLYQSSALVQVVIRSSSNNNQADYNNLLASEQLVQTEATLATSDPVLRAVASHYPGLTASELAREVSASPRTNTQLFEIDVVDPSPARAASLANDIAATLIKQQLQAIQQDNAQAKQQIQQNIDLTSQQINATTAKISALQAKGRNQGQIALLQAQLNGLQQHFNQWQTALAQLELAQAQSGNPCWPPGWLVAGSVAGAAVRAIGHTCAHPRGNPPIIGMASPGYDLARQLFEARRRDQPDRKQCQC